MLLVSAEITSILDVGNGIFSRKVLPTAALVVLLFGQLVAIWRVRRNVPSLIRLARHADVHYQSQDRLSTALEFSASKPTPVQQKLLLDAATRAEQIVPSELVRILTPRQAIQIVTIFVGILFVLISPFLNWEGSVHSDVDLLTAEQEAEIIAQVRRATELIGKDATRKDDAHFQALTRALERLESEIGAGTFDAVQLQRELDNVMAHLNLAYKTQPPPVLAGESKEVTEGGQGQGDESNFADTGDWVDSTLYGQREVYPRVDDASLASLMSALDELERRLDEMEGRGRDG